MKVKIKDLEPNPYRNMEKYPINKEKIDRLKGSIEQTGFWDNILCRVGGKKFQLAYGHHRLIAIQELGIQEIDIPCKDISDADMVRIMALENREQEDMSQSVLIETVRIVRDFLNVELAKYNTWDTLGEINQGLFENQRSFETVKGMRIGHGTILKFLGGGWKEWKIKSALDTLDADDIKQEAIEKFESTGMAEGFKKAIRNINKTEEVVTLEEQVHLAEIVKNKIKENPVTGVSGGQAYYSKIEDIIREEIGETDELVITQREIENELKGINKDTKQLSARIGVLNGKLQNLGVEKLRTLSSLIMIKRVSSLLTNYGMLTYYLGIRDKVNKKPKSIN